MSSFIVFHRFTPIVIGLLTVLVFLLTNKYPSGYLFFMGLNILISTALFGNLLKWRFKKLMFWNHLVPPFLFLVSGTAMFLFIESSLIRTFLSIIMALTIFFYAEHIFNRFYWSNKYQQNAIEHTAIILNVLTIFFTATALSGFRLFFHMPLLILVLIFAAASFLIIVKTYLLSHIGNLRSVLFALVGTVVLTELFLVVSFFPTGLYVNGATMTLITYAYLGLSRAYLSDILSKNVYGRYAIVGGALLILILSSATWT